MQEKDKFFFAVTPLDKGIDNNAEYILYAEEGCARLCKDFTNVKILDNIHSSGNELYNDTLFIRKVYKKVLTVISKKLNEFHGLTYNTNIWSLILYYWLDYYIEVLFQKYILVDYAINNYNVYTYALDKKYYKFPYKKNGFFIWCINDDLYNFQLYSQILEYKGANIKKYIEIDGTAGKKKINVKNMPVLQKIINKTAKTAKTIIVNPNNFEFTYKEMMYMYIKSKFKMGYFYCNDDYIPVEEYNTGLREKISIKNYNTNNDFEKMVLQMVFKDMPTCYLEGFDNYRKFCFQTKAKNIVEAEDWHYLTSAALMASNVKSVNGKLFTLKTGGDANILKGKTETYDDLNLSDVLYSSGWKKDGICQVKTLTNPRMWKAKLSKKYIEKKTDVLYIGNVLWSYRCIMGNISSLHSKEYLDDCVNFLERLSKENIEICARFFPIKSKWDICKIIQERNINIKIDDYKEDFITAAQKTRLAVVDFFNTPWAELLILDIPMIMVGLPYNEYFSEEGYEVVKILREANMYFDTYSDAIVFINNNIADIEIWWKEKRRIYITRQLKSKYIWCSDNAKKEWINEFLKI